MVRRNKRRFILSLLVLTIYGAFMGISGLASQYSPVPIIVTWLITTPIAGYILGMVWQFDLILRVREKENENAEQSSEKRKRERIDTVLRDLSDADLVILRQRLQDGTIDEDVLYDHIVRDDGELVQRN